MTNRTPTDVVLEVSNLSTSFELEESTINAVRDVSWSLRSGEIVGVVGESGSGKSVSMLSMLGLLPSPPAQISGGPVTFAGKDLLTLSDKELRNLRGDEITLIFQDPMTSFNPVRTIGDQISEVIRVHNRDKSAAEIRDRAIELLTLVGVPSPETRLRQYPHEYSGGMRQRAMIAMAIANEPKVIIADEPTTALDVTIQAQILELLEVVRRETGAAIVLITHDLGLIAEVADRVLVMYAGKVVESTDVQTLFSDPQHPYTLGLLASLPRIDMPNGELYSIPGQPPNPAALPSGCAFAERCELSRGRAECTDIQPPLDLVNDDHLVACHFSDEVDTLDSAAIALADPPTPVEDTPDRPRETLLEVKGLKVHFPVRSRIIRRVVGHIQAVDGVDLTVRTGETLGLVGESGSGKSTTGQAILRLIDPTAGSIEFEGTDLATVSQAKMRPYRRQMQIVFQDPYQSLNPGMTVREIVAEPLRVHREYTGAERNQRVDELLDLVGLGPEMARRFPHEFSGGQRQRIGIARALALDPKLLILDEPVSALDVSIQAQIVNLLERLQDELSLGYLFIAHDLSVVRHISDRVSVMYLGRIVETGTTDQVFKHAAHPYTQALLSAIPTPDPSVDATADRIVLEGEVPSPQSPPSGCRFRTRCWKAQDICATEDPTLIDHASNGHETACFFPELTE